MESKKEYIISCWHCGAPYDAYDSPYCNHNDPTKVCPFCLSCFCDAPEEVKTQFIQNCPKDLLEEKMKSQTGDQKLGEMLVKRKMITLTQLLQAVDRQKKNQSKLGETLIEMGLVSKERLDLLLLEQKEMDEINLEKFQLNFDLIEKLGVDFCLNYQMIPLELLEDKKKSIFRFAVATKEAALRLKTEKLLDGYTLVPYRADKNSVDRLLQEIKDGDVLLLT